MFYAGLIDKVTNSCAETKLTDINEFIMEKERTFDMATRGIHKFSPNPTGKLICGMLLSSSRGVVESKYRSQVLHRATILIVALHVFRNSVGHYPPTLDVLVPDIISEIPLDPYDGQPMRYDHSKAIIYSVGEDLKDSSGSTELLPRWHKKNPQSQCRRTWQTEDFVFEIREKIKQGESAEPSKATPSASSDVQ